MPGLPADEVVIQARRAIPTLKTLIVSAHDSEVYLEALIRVQIDGYLLKDHEPKCLLQAVRCIQQGGVWFSQTVAKKLWGIPARNQSQPTPTLSGRERAILEGLSRGETNSDIAHRLNLAEQTVRNYASSMYHKIGVHSRWGAAVWARERGIQ